MLSLLSISLAHLMVSVEIPNFSAIWEIVSPDLTSYSMISDLGLSETEVLKSTRELRETPEALGSKVWMVLGSAESVAEGKEEAKSESPPITPVVRAPTEARPMIELWMTCFWNLP